VVRQESVSQLVANVLRERIVSGELSDGALLARLDDLIDEFQVSKPSIREALRILETEGLVTVKRGKAGGAIVHAPSALGTAYTLGFLLESQQVTLADLAQALRLLEPVCAGLCAANQDAEVLKSLNDLVEQTRANMADELQAVSLSRRFHEQIVAGCGNDTLIAVLGALEALWSTHEVEWTCRLPQERFDDHRRAAGVKEHERIVKAIESGDASRAQRVMADHMRENYRLPADLAADMKVQRPPMPGAF